VPQTLFCGVDPGLCRNHGVGAVDGHVVAGRKRAVDELPFVGRDRMRQLAMSFFEAGALDRGELSLITMERVERVCHPSDVTAARSRRRSDSRGEATSGSAGRRREFGHDLVTGILTDGGTGRARSDGADAKVLVRGLEVNRRQPAIPPISG
jgi:hypothetical protein